MGTPIGGKGHTSPLVGTEKVPLSPDGYATTQEVADLATGGGGLTTATAHLNGPAIMTMFSAPAVVVPAPGAGKALVFVNGSVETVPVTVGYLAGGSLQCYYGTSPDPATGAASTELGSLSLFRGDEVPTKQIAVMTPSQVTEDVSIALGRTFVENKAITFGTNVSEATVFGPIVTASVADGGTSYAVNDTGTINMDGYTGGATYRVTAAPGGIVSAFTVTAAGDGYSTASNPIGTATGGGQPGGGSGLTLNITAVHASDGDVYVTVVYYVIDLH